MDKNTDSSLMFMGLVNQPLILLSDDSIVLDMNASAEDVFKTQKITIIGKAFSLLCPMLASKVLLSVDDKSSFEKSLFNTFTSQFEDKTILWIVVRSNELKNSNQFLLIGSVVHPAEEVGSINVKKVERSTHDEIANLNQALTGQVIDKKKSTLAHVKNIYSYMESIIAVMPGSVYWLNKDGVYLGCNNNFARLFNLKSRQEIVGKTYSDLYDEESASHYKNADATVMNYGVPLSLEEPLYYPNGIQEVYLSNKVPIRDSEDQIIGMLGISIDITQRKKMEEELQYAKLAAEAGNHAKSEFIVNISHDIRTPMTGIIAFSRFLKEQDNVDEMERKELAKDIYNASEQLLNLLNGVLDVVSTDLTTDNNVKLKSFDLVEMIEDLIQLEKPAVRSNHLELHQYIDENIPKYIVSDKMKLHRILLNLIGNAIKFTEKGYIRIEAKLQEKDDEKATVVFVIEDTGIGIPEESQSQIFEGFYKVHSSYKGKYRGNGIGLHIVEKYVKLLGGKIEVSSTLGKGTTFFLTFTFPIGEMIEEEVEDKDYREMLEQEREAILLAEENANSSSYTPTVAHTSSNIKILLVEDNVSALKSLKLLFIPYKFHIMEVQNAEDAFELVKRETFDLIITDIGLPGMQGDELVAKIRQLEKTKKSSKGKIVALTGHATEGELAETCRKVGVDELFQKPMQPKILENLLMPLMKDFKNIKLSRKPKQDRITKAKPPGLLGIDLPDTEEQLFEIDKYPLLDLKIGTEMLGSIEFAKNLLKDLNKDGIVPELGGLKKAHTIGDWETVRTLAHKMKGGATMGTVRLYYAFLYMERYIKAGHSSCVEALYAQMLRVIDETVEYLAKNL